MAVPKKSKSLRLVNLKKKFFIKKNLIVLKNKYKNNFSKKIIIF